MERFQDINRSKPEEAAGVSVSASMLTSKKFIAEMESEQMKLKKRHKSIKAAERKIET